MKYSVFTTANKSYFPFVDIFVNSLTENCLNLNKIYIADSGLGEYRKYLNNKSNVCVIDTDILDEYTGVHSEGWVKATQQKTRVLYQLLSNINFEEPLIMIDSDVCVLHDLSQVINTNFDMQVTTMHNGGHTRDDGIFIREIASFLIINNCDFGKNFVGNWIKQMEEFGENGTPFPHETPALNMQLQSLNNEEFKIEYLKEIKVCADQILTPDTLSVHFKSNGTTSDDPVVNFEKRIMSVNNTTDNDFDIGRYLNGEQYVRWRCEYGK
tara:strand:+ start:2314 stop:3117 length:804 start_codon:yes stop_codon:yes gene_type:complete